MGGHGLAGSGKEKILWATLFLKLRNHLLYPAKAFFNIFIGCCVGDTNLFTGGFAKADSRNSCNIFLFQQFLGEFGTRHTETGYVYHDVECAVRFAVGKSRNLIKNICLRFANASCISTTSFLVRLVSIASERATWMKVGEQVVEY